MFSLSSIIRIYIILSIVIMIAFFIMLTSVDVLLEPIWPIISTETKIIYSDLYATVIILSLTGIVFGLLVSVFIFDRGINKYQDFIRRFDNIEQYDVIRPSIIKFPAQDEFGNLGSLMNSFIEKIDYYDQLKSLLAKSEKEKFETISQILQYPVLVVNTNTNEPYVSFYNTAFKDMFLKKNVFIDNNGKPQVQYYNLEESPIVYFTHKDEEETSFFVDQQLNQLKYKTILWEKKHILTDMIIKELSGDKKYKCEQIYCIPINNDLENTMSQMIYVYINPELVEKEKKIALVSPELI